MVSVSPLIALSIVSVLTGIGALVVFRLTSNQSGIRVAKDRIKASLLEIRLYKDEPGLVLRAQGRILVATLGYLKFMVIPLLVMLPPLAILLLELEPMFGLAPLRPGERTILTAIWRDPVTLDTMTANIVAPEGVVVETSGLRIEQRREQSWRIRPMKTGPFDLVLEARGHRMKKRIHVGESLVRLHPVRTTPSMLQDILGLNDDPLPPDSPFESIDVHYPKREFRVLGWQTDWLVLFLVGSVLSAFGLQGAVGVKI